jgi:hypothetical protein
VHSETESNLTFSPVTAREAAQFFCLRRYLTKFGLLLVGAIFICIGMMAVTYTYMGANWFFGFVATLVGMNVLLHTSSYFMLPRIAANSVASLKSPVGHLVMGGESFTLSIDGNVTTIPWSRIRYVWLRERFVVLGLSLFSMLHLPTQGLSTNAREELEKRSSKAIGA